MANGFLRKGLLTLAVAGFFACEGWSEVERLQAEVEAIHDAPMMKIDELETLQKRAGNLLATAAPEQKAGLENFISEAQAAHGAMFDWMAQYRAPEKGKLKKEAAIDYLNQQKATAELMSKQVFTAIEHGNKLLKDQ